VSAVILSLACSLRVLSAEHACKDVDWHLAGNRHASERYTGATEAGPEKHRHLAKCACTAELMLERQQLTLDPAEVSIVNLDFCRTLKTTQTGGIPP
jgi:hypothetical protein